jgi:hypothetical protein
MTTALFLFGVSLTVRWVYLAMNWYAARIHMQMLRDVARAKYRSRTPGGSTYSDSRLPQTMLSETAGVEPRSWVAAAAAAAPPATPNLVGASDPRTGTAPTRPQTPVNIGRHPGWCPPASTSGRVMVHG